MKIEKLFCNPVNYDKTFQPLSKATIRLINLIVAETFSYHFCIFFLISVYKLKLKFIFLQVDNFYLPSLAFYSETIIPS